MADPYSGNERVNWIIHDKPMTPFFVDSGQELVTDY